MKVQWKRLGFLVFFTTTQALLAGVCLASHGHDWYCPDPEAHAQFEQHLRQYHNQNADEVVVLLEKVYNDNTLSAEEKKVQATDLMKSFAIKVKLGEGD